LRSRRAATVRSRVPFFYAAQRLDQLPPVVGRRWRFAGRSNVGKSSLLNALTGHHALARVSGEPGRTRQLNFFDVGGRLTLVDMPGYGYARAAKAVKQDWQGLMFRIPARAAYTASRDLLLDARIEVKDADGVVMELLDRAAVTYQLVLTKIDGVKPAALERKLAEAVALARKHPAAHPDVLVTSSTTGQGVEALRAADCDSGRLVAPLADIIPQMILSSDGRIRGWPNISSTITGSYTLSGNPTTILATGAVLASGFPPRFMDRWELHGR